MLRNFRLILPHLRRRGGAYLLGVVAIAASVVLRLWVPRLVRQGFEEIERLGIAGGERAALARALAATAGLVVLAALAGALVRTTSRILVLGASRRVAHDLRDALFRHLLRLAPSFYVRNPTGQVLSRCINDLQFAQNLAGPVVLYLVETAALFGVGVTMMASIHPRTTILALLPFPPFLVIARRLARRIQETSRAAQQSLGEVAQRVDESLSGQLVVKTMGLEESELERFRAHCENYRRLNLTVTKLRAVLVPMMMGVAGLSSTIVLISAGTSFAADLSVGDVVALVLYIGMLAVPTRTLGFVINSLRRGAAALGRIEEILETEPGLLDPPEPLPLPAGAGALRVEGLTVEMPRLADQPHLNGALPPAAGGADDRPRRLLEGVTLEVPAGHTLGVVGRSGAGKTTLVRALARQLEIPPGTIFLDGVDVTRVRLADVRGVIGYVPQEAFLFGRTLAENVAYGRPTASREEIEAAARAARLDQDLGQLPRGLDTLVGQRGVMLSGGQRQRAALARVLLLQPRVLLLDDTLSAVDTQTADAILAALRPFAAARTTVIVSHRLATVQHADEIVVLEDGRVVERGTHDELLGLGGHYADLWRRQQRESAARRRARRLARELEEEEAP